MKRNLEINCGTVGMEKEKISRIEALILLLLSIGCQKMIQIGYYDLVHRERELDDDMGGVVW